MPDLWIRDFPVDDLALLDEQAKKLGLTRAEYVRRQLQRSVRRLESQVTVDNLGPLADLLGDIEDESVIAQAWS